MANDPDSPVNAVLSGSEDDESPVPGQDDQNAGGPPLTSAGMAALSRGTIGQTTSAAFPPKQDSDLKVDTDKKVHPHMALLAGLLNKVLGNIRNAPGNPRNAFDAGFMQASPNAQAMQKATIGKAQSEAELTKMQVSMTGIKLIQAEYMLKRLPQQLQEAHLKVVSDFKMALMKDGATMIAEGDNENASDGQALHLNQTDSRAKSGAGQFYSLPTMDQNGKARFDVVYVPNKNTLQEDFKWTDADGNEQIIPKGTPMYGAMAKLVELKGKELQDQTKAEHKQWGDALKANIPEGELLTTANWLQSQKDQNTSGYQANQKAADAQIKSLNATAKQIQANKEAEKRAGIDRSEEKSMFGKQGVVDTPQGRVMMPASQARAEYGDDFTLLSSTQSEKYRDSRANADASMNALTNYERTFAKTKVSPKDQDQMRNLVLAQQKDAGKVGGGILSDIIEEIPFAGPYINNMNQLVDRYMRGTIQSDAWKNMSPEAQTMMAQYSMAVVANFANMKQMLGSVGRNPDMIRAEMNQIPVPYLTRDAAQAAFTTKISDLKQRNSNIPRQRGTQDPSEINREGIWEQSGREDRANTRKKSTTFLEKIEEAVGLRSSDAPTE